MPGQLSLVTLYNHYAPATDNDLRLEIGHRGDRLAMLDAIEGSEALPIS